MKTFCIIFIVMPLAGSLTAQNKNVSGQKTKQIPTNTSFIDYFSKRDNSKMVFYYTLLLGDSSRNAGDLALAEKQYLKALTYTQKIREAKGHFNYPLLSLSIFDPYERLGNLYIQSNNLRKAELYYTKAKEEKEKYLARKSVFKVSPYIGLGRIDMLRGNFTEAALNFAQAEKLLYSATTSGYDFGIPEREILLNQYELLMKQKNYKQAYFYLKKLSFGGSTGGDQVPRIFQLKADYYLHTGEYKKCEYYLKKAKLYAQKISFSAVNLKILRTKALLYWVQGNIEEATQTFKQLGTLHQKNIHQNFASMTEYERESFYALLRDDFDLFNAFVIQTTKDSNQQLRFEKLYNNQLFSKALLLNEINKLKNRIKSGSNEQLKSDLAEWENQKALLTGLYFAKKKNPSSINQTETRIEELEQKLNTQNLQATSLPKNWKEIQMILKPDEAAIEIIRIKRFALTATSKFEFTDSIVYAALIIDSQISTPKFVLLENGNELESKYLNYYRNCINAKQTDTLSYNQFWLPLQNDLRTFKKLYISSDGVFNQINLNILFNTKTQRYLLDEVDLTFVTNTKDLLRPNRSLASKNSSLYARPRYRVDSSTSIRLTKSLRANRSLANETLENFRQQEFEDLPGTEQEIKQLENLFLKSGWTTETKLGEDASEENIKTTNNPAVLHIATHGFFLKTNDQEKINSMIRSGIILAGVNNNKGLNEDGVLTAYEATNLHLDSTYLVVLSACETGLGDIKNGEGVYGLQRGFIVAGTRYLLMSLWKVDDEATALLMASVYSEWLKSGDLPEALKTAQLSLRNKYPQPYYWGSFILLGN